MPGETGGFSLDQCARSFTGVPLQEGEEVVVGQGAYGRVSPPQALAPKPRPGSVLGVEPDRESSEPLLQHALLPAAYQVHIGARAVRQLAQKLEQRGVRASQLGGGGKGYQRAVVVEEKDERGRRPQLVEDGTHLRGG